ncbi:hypothetical protein BLNAU_25195 [Blattamonas nauphoetae]|uniref:Uncharacterized protein n=1 Tax=Blattamonas nauphoetae TaxID=2049346 RepID=A0ABQ9WKB0_9EUKA|nr:hypothetical protein BLNAU_25195 [Blattamonas nauphoetae]
MMMISGLLSSTSTYPWKNGMKKTRSGQIWKTNHQTLFSEGFEDTLEQKLLNDKTDFMVSVLLIIVAPSLTCLSNIIVVPEPNHKQPTTIEETKQLKMTLLVCMGTTLHGISSVLKKIVAQLIPAVRKRSNSEAMKIVNRSLNRRSDSDSGEWPSFIVNDRKGRIGSNPRGAVQISLLEG